MKKVYGVSDAHMRRLTAIVKKLTKPKPKESLYGVLFSGPQGVGKTMLVNAICNDVCKNNEVTVFRLSASNLNSDLKAKEVFAVARAAKPTILFVDECDSVFASDGSRTSNVKADYDRVLARARCM